MSEAFDYISVSPYAPIVVRKADRRLPRERIRALLDKGSVLDNLCTPLTLTPEDQGFCAKYSPSGARFSSKRAQQMK